ncbi:cupin domain-containing protein [Glacieibacterium frigidum]|uniref:Cupin domain-containing protein n=1 Tax=Glacieibacterium frigidum TaxID=2593303 RepID=A0A552U899_9SPHN|nr:cupin domain-containing protein [Glacieibacterium frigidum]TRW14409.1 cupin domain-containing protein [Glacieibacterium frigidum]
MTIDTTIRAAAMLAALAAAPAAAPQVTRTDLQRHDLGIAGRETVQARIDFPPGALAPPHMHPGEEIIYILAGPLEYQVAGGTWRRYDTGEVLFIPAGTVHAARNTGMAPSAELATYVVEKGKPLVVLVP